jgi:hypothetical protein
MTASVPIGEFSRLTHLSVKTLHHNPTSACCRRPRSTPPPGYRHLPPLRVLAVTDRVEQSAIGPWCSAGRPGTRGSTAHTATVKIVDKPHDGSRDEPVGRPRRQNRQHRSPIRTDRLHSSEQVADRAIDRR